MSNDMPTHGFQLCAQVRSIASRRSSCCLPIDAVKLPNFARSFLGYRVSGVQLQPIVGGAGLWTEGIAEVTGTRHRIECLVGFEIRQQRDSSLNRALHSAGAPCLHQ
jgi:hypothetical protein